MIRDRLASLTVTPLLYAIGALLLLSALLGVRGCAVAAARDTAVAQKEKAEAELATAITEREAWKAKTADVLSARDAYAAMLATIKQEQARAEAAAAAAAKAAAAAVAAAQRDEATAERRLADFQRRYVARPKSCDDALKILDTVCPAIGRDY